MFIYSNDNIRKIQKSKNAKITVRENNGLYSTLALRALFNIVENQFKKIELYNDVQMDQ